MTKNFEKITIWLELILFFVLVATITVFGINKITQDQRIKSYILSQKLNFLSKSMTDAEKANKITIYLFSGAGCSHCTEEKKYLEELKKKYSGLTVKEYEVFENEDNNKLLQRLLKEKEMNFTGVPVTFINDKSYVGFAESLKFEFEDALLEALKSGSPDTIGPLIEQNKTPQKQWSYKKAEPQKINPIKIGSLDITKLALPAATVMIALLDSFNPCTFFVLLSLLGLLLHAKSRKKMIFIGLIYVFFSFVLYFLFMAAWLNIFLITSHLYAITIIAGIIAITIAAINIKDFFAFRQGITLTITDNAKTDMFEKMRKLVKSASFPSIILGTVVLAVSANTYELLCTAGFPMVFTKMLTINNLPKLVYYLYLVLYNVIYVIPLAVIVIIFAAGSRKKNITEWQARLLKLISGMMMLGLGTILVISPATLSNLYVSMIIFISTILLAIGIALVMKKKEDK